MMVTLITCQWFAVIRGDQWFDFPTLLCHPLAQVEVPGT